MDMIGVLNTSNPMESGVVVDWDAMTKIWEHTFKGALQVNPADIKAALVTEAPF